MCEPARPECTPAARGGLRAPVRRSRESARGEGVARFAPLFAPPLSFLTLPPHPSPSPYPSFPPLLRHLAPHPPPSPSPPSPIPPFPASFPSHSLPHFPPFPRCRFGPGLGGMRGSSSCMDFRAGTFDGEEPPAGAWGRRLRAPLGPARPRPAPRSKPLPLPTAPLGPFLPPSNPSSTPTLRPHPCL